MVRTPRQVGARNGDSKSMLIPGSELGDLQPCRDPHRHRDVPAYGGAVTQLAISVSLPREYLAARGQRQIAAARESLVTAMIFVPTGSRTGTGAVRSLFVPSPNSPL